MGIGKRLWNVARAQVSDFASAFSLDEEIRERRRMDAELDAEVAKEVADTIGAKAGRRARRVADKAEDARDQAFHEAQARGPGGQASANEVEGWYRTLELPVGSEFSEVRKSYRRLLTKYHPDKYAKDPDKYAAATEVTRKINAAYNGLKAMRGPS